MTLPALNSLAGQFWMAVLATLQQRGMLRTAGQHPIYPHALAGIETDRCVIFIEAFKGEISKRRLEELARTWERRGWLTPPRDAVSPRRVTPTLLRLAGLAPGGENDDTMTGMTGDDRGRVVVTGR